MSINPVMSWASQNNPLWVDLPTLSTTALNVASLTANTQVVAPLVSSINMNLSTINGLVYPPPSALGNIQTAQNNPPPVSGKVIQNTGSYLPLLSTTQSFNFVQNSIYDLNFPVGLNITQSSDHPFNLYLGAQVQGDAYFTTGAVLNVEAGQNQVLDTLPIRWIKNAQATTALPLVFGCFAQGLNPTSSITISANTTASPQNLIAVNKLT
jgi:hypothetical protein